MWRVGWPPSVGGEVVTGVQPGFRRAMINGMREA
jgi:hypothetical protein